MQHDKTDLGVHPKSHCCDKPVALFTPKQCYTLKDTAGLLTYDVVAVPHERYAFSETLSNGSFIFPCQIQ